MRSSSAMRRVVWSFIVTVVTFCMLAAFGPKAFAQDAILGRQQAAAPDDDDEPPPVPIDAPPAKGDKDKKGDPADDPKLPPIHVKVALYVLNVGKFDLASGTYTVDFYLDLESVDGSPIGTTQFEFMNGRASSSQKIIDTPNEKFYRIQATLMTKVDLSQFPWDTHDLPIILEDMQRTSDGEAEDRGIVYELDPDQSGIDPYVNIVGWNLNGYTAEVDTHYYGVPTKPGLTTNPNSRPPNQPLIAVDTQTTPEYNLKGSNADPSTFRTVFPNSKTKKAETYSRYKFNIRIGRLRFIATVKTFLPVCCFFIVVLISLLMSIEKLDQRQTMNTTMLLASVMYHINITNSLPPVGYLTTADKVLMATYTTVAINLFITVYMVRLNMAWNGGGWLLAMPPEKDKKKDDKKEPKPAAPPVALAPGVVLAPSQPPPPVEPKPEKKKEEGEKKEKKEAKEGEKSEKKEGEKKDEKKKDEKKDDKKDEKKDAKPAKPPPCPDVLKWRRRSWFIVLGWAILAYGWAFISHNG